jgi:hypothetical protein
MRNNVIAATLSAVIFGILGYATAATVPDADGTFHGCVNPHSGALRVVDSADECHRSENPVTWNQSGPAGAKGDPGPKGDTGATGPAGPASIDALDGSDCTRADGSAGTVTVTVGDDDAISMTCAARTTWCATHTPSNDDTFLHQHVTCDEETRTLTYTCEDGWRDANEDHADGCEASDGPPTAISFAPQAVSILALLISDRPKSSVDVQPDCDSSPTVSCTGGSPESSLSSVRVDSWMYPNDPPRAEAVPDAAAKTFTVTQRVRLVTDEPIPVTFADAGLGGQCAVSIDSRRGASPDVKLTYTDTVRTDAPNGPTVVSTPPTLTGLTPDDVDISGPGFLCYASGFDLSGLYDALASSLGPWIVEGATVCGAPEPVYYQRCRP